MAMWVRLARGLVPPVAVKLATKLPMEIGNGEEVVGQLLAVEDRPEEPGGEGVDLWGRVELLPGWELDPKRLRGRMVTPRRLMVEVPASRAEEEAVAPAPPLRVRAAEEAHASIIQSDRALALAAMPGFRSSRWYTYGAAKLDGLLDRPDGHRWDAQPSSPIADLRRMGDPRPNWQRFKLGIGYMAAWPAPGAAEAFWRDVEEEARHDVAMALLTPEGGPLTPAEGQRLLGLFMREAETLSLDEQAELDRLAARAAAHPPTKGGAS